MIKPRVPSRVPYGGMPIWCIHCGVEPSGRSTEYAERCRGAKREWRSPLIVSFGIGQGSGGMVNISKCS